VIAPRAALPLTFALVSACTPPDEPECVGERAEEHLPATVMRQGDTVRVVGFDGAADGGGALEVEGESMPLDVDAAGRFDAVASSQADHVTLLERSWRVRAEDALQCVVGEPLAAGTVANDVEVTLCDGQPIAAVPASGDGTLDLVPLSGADGARVVFDVDGEGRGANPWNVSVAGDRAAVSLFGQHEVAWVDACDAAELGRGRAVDADGAAVLVEVSPTARLDTPRDVDGDGAPETDVSRMRLLHPEGVAVVDGRVLVSFTNLLQAGTPARFGPGVVMAWDVVDDELIPAEHLVLPFDNPQSLTVGLQGEVWASCSGALEQTTEGFRAVGEGGLVRLSTDPLGLVDVIALDDFAPGTPAFTTDHVIVGSLVRADVLVLPAGAERLADGDVLALRDVTTDSIFETLALPGGLVAAVDFATDRVHVVDPRGPTLQPWPFSEPFRLNLGNVPRGAQALARVPPTEDRASPDAVVLLGLSAELVPLRLWEVVGP
jgi:hypothetical protein